MRGLISPISIGREITLQNRISLKDAHVVLEDSLVAKGGTSVKRRVFVILFFSIFSSMLGIGIIAPLLPIYAESFGASGLWIGIIFSGFSISRSIFMPIVGRWSDKRGRKI